MADMRRDLRRHPGLALEDAARLGRVQRRASSLRGDVEDVPLASYAAADRQWIREQSYSSLTPPPHHPASSSGRSFRETAAMSRA